MATILIGSRFRMRSCTWTSGPPKRTRFQDPDLVVWQVGTNAVVKEGYDFKKVGAAIRAGLQTLQNRTDAVLMDPQSAPQVVEKPSALAMVELIEAAAQEANLNLFRRFALMRRWNEVEHVSFDQMIKPDQLHQNDWGYVCLASVPAAVITEAAIDPTSRHHSA